MFVSHFGLSFQFKLSLRASRRLHLCHSVSVFALPLSLRVSLSLYQCHSVSVLACTIVTPCQSSPVPVSLQAVFGRSTRSSRLSLAFLLFDFRDFCAFWPAVLIRVPVQVWVRTPATFGFYQYLQAFSWLLPETSVRPPRLTVFPVCPSLQIVSFVVMYWVTAGVVKWTWIVTSTVYIYSVSVTQNINISNSLATSFGCSRQHQAVAQNKGTETHSVCLCAC
jgi:hypothetical protein